MKKMALAFPMIVLVFLSGCATMRPVQHVKELPKTNKVLIGEIVFFKDLKDKQRIDSGHPDYQELIGFYKAELAKELNEKGFLIQGLADGESLVLKTKINNYPAPLGGMLGALAMGLVRARVEVYFDSKLVYTFEEAANTTLGFSGKLQLRRFVVPRVAKRLERQFFP